MVMSLTEHKIVPVITMTSISQNTGNANIVHNKTNFYYIVFTAVIIINVFCFFEEYSGCCTCNSFYNQLQIY